MIRNVKHNLKTQNMKQKDVTYLTSPTFLNTAEIFKSPATQLPVMADCHSECGSQENAVLTLVAVHTGDRSRLLVCQSV